MASQRDVAGDVEILIHVTAPSKVADDATYRRLAQAYLSFAPGSRANVTIPSSPEPAQPQPAAPNQHDDGLFTVLESFCSDSQEMSFKGALDNRFSPRVASRKTRRTATPQPHVVPDPHVTTPTAAARDLPSQISDSYPMPDAELFNVTPTRVLQRYMGTRVSTSRSAAQVVTPSPTFADAGDVPQVEPPAKTTVDISSSLPTSELNTSQAEKRQRQATIPVTPLAPAESRKRKVEEVEAHDTSIMDITHISSSLASSDSSSIPLQRSESDPLPAKRLRRLIQEPGSDTAGLTRSASDTTVPGRNQQPGHHIAQPSSSALSSTAALSQVPSSLPPPSASSSSSLSIRPPSPPVGVDDLSLAGLVSAKLAKLAQDLSSRYRPTLRRRKPDPLDRGHWRVDCSGWPAETRAAAWAFLTSYIRNGLAGWGVWCRRSEDHACIKLYGWACIAKHTYLLLYLVSERQVKATGAQWLDADGEVALEVLP